MGMFTSYKLTPEEYIPNNIHATGVTPPEPRYPLVAYNAMGEPIGYTWNYGDSIYLEFNTTGHVVYDEEFIEDAETYLTGKRFQLVVYNFRYDVVAHCECDAAARVRILSDSFYPCTLVPGVYKFKLNLIDENAKILYTLMDGDDCILYIK